MNKPGQEGLPIPASFAKYHPRNVGQWEIITQRLAVLYLTIRHPEPQSLDALYDCYSWINELVNGENPTHGITQEYKDYFYTHNPHDFLSVIAYEFERYHRMKGVGH